MDLVVDAMPTKLNMEPIERDISKSKGNILEPGQLHMENISEWIECPLTSQIRINLFLQEWEKLKKREVESLVCKAQLQLEFIEYTIFCNPHFCGWSLSL